MIDALSEAALRLRDSDGGYDNAAVERYRDIKARIAHLPSASLVAAVQTRSLQADNEQMARLAELLARPPDDESDRGRPLDAKDVAAVRALVEDWGKRMLASGDAERWQLSQIAMLARHVPDVSLLPLLKRLLDENL